MIAAGSIAKIRKHQVSTTARDLSGKQTIAPAVRHAAGVKHNLDVIKTADDIIDLGPEGGHKGGPLLACGTPEEIAASQKSHTGQLLARYV